MQSASSAPGSACVSARSPAFARKIITSRPVSRVLSGVASATAIHLGRRSRNASCNQPGWRVRKPTWHRAANRSCLATPIWSCSRWGLPCHACCQARGALLPHPFTLARDACALRAVCFLWHFPWGCPRRPLAATVLPWSPDFPPAQLYPCGRRGQQPSGRLVPINKGCWSLRVKGQRAGMHKLFMTRRNHLEIQETSFATL